MRLPKPFTFIPPGNCGYPTLCSPAHQYYVRGGWAKDECVWKCETCQRTVTPDGLKDIEAPLNQEETKALSPLRRLHSNDGFGEDYRFQPSISCPVPLPEVVDVVGG